MNAGLRLLAAGLLLLLGTDSAIAYSENDGWPQSSRSSPRGPGVIDFDGDGKLDVITTAVELDSTRLWAWDHGGGLLEGWPLVLPGQAFYGVATVDLDNDGWTEIVFSSTHPSQAVHALRSGGDHLNGWPIHTRFRSRHLCQNADLNGDGQMETIVHTTKRGGDSLEVHVFEPKGTAYPGWPVRQATDVEAAGAIGDLDLDGDLELLWAGDVGAHGPGWIYVLNHDGTPFGKTARFVESPQKIVAAPVSLVDLAGDSRPEIVALDCDGSLLLLDAEGQRVPGWPPAWRAGRPSAMAVPIGASHGRAKQIWGSSDAAYVYLWDRHADLMPGWPWKGADQIHAQAIIADLDGDPDVEAFIGGSRPFYWAFELDGSVVAGWPIYSGAAGFGTGVLTDLDADGDTDIVYHGGDGLVHVYDTPGVYAPDRIECARWMYDNWHTATYHKDLYREAETAEAMEGWRAVADTSAWGHQVLVPERVSSEPALTLLYRTQVPAFEHYSLWARVDPASTEQEGAPLLAEIDGAALPGSKCRSARSPGRWIWVELGRRVLHPGTHELRLRTRAEHPVIDRLLLTTRVDFPLLKERPHAW